MRKFLAFALCAILVISSMAVSASAEEAESVASGNSYRDEFIDALMNEESLWSNVPALSSSIQFIDLNFDGQLEFVVQRIISGITRDSSVFSYDGQISQIDFQQKSNYIIFGDENSRDNLKLYYDKNNATYRLIGTGSNGDDYQSETQNYEIVFDKASNQYNYVNISGYQHNINNDTYEYYVDKSENSYDNVSKEEYDNNNTQFFSNLEDANMKYDRFDLRDYLSLSSSEKQSTLENLYDSFTYDKQEEVNTITISDYDKYVKEVLAPKYNYADTSDMTRTISTKDYANDLNGVLSWAKRSGILGYDVVDMNNDNILDMLVYVFDSNSQSSLLRVEYYTLNNNGNIVHKNSYDVFKEAPGLFSYCVGEIAEVNGKKYLLLETFTNSSFFSDGQYVDYEIFDVADNGELFNKYSIKQDGAGSSNIEYFLYTCSISGDVSKKTIWKQSDSNYGTNIQGMQSAFNEIGFPKTTKTTNDVFDILGFKNYKTSNSISKVISYPTYYFEDSFKTVFHVISAPVDATYKNDDSAYEFKSTVKHYSDDNPDINPIESNTNNTDNNTIKSPQTGAKNNYIAILAVIVAGGAAAVLSGSKRKEDI